MRLHSSASSSGFAALVESTRTSFGPVQSTSAPTSASSAIIVSTSLIRGTLRRTTGSVAIRVAARMGSAPFLFPAADTRPLRGMPPSITKLSMSASATSIEDTKRGIVPSPVEVTRDRAWETLTRYTKSEALLRHALAVEAAVRAYARRLGGDEEFWGATALLHDFDYEIHPTLDRHPQDGAPILREEGYPEELIEAVLSHAEHLHMPRDTDLKRALFACDELAGFIHACGLVRPDGIETLTPKSVKKKLKQPSFAAGVHRDEVYAGAELLGVDLDEHIETVTDAMKPIAGELGLRTAADAA
jgi:putative nucleotidyltransferase with HDIG domain